MNGVTVSSAVDTCQPTTLIMGDKANPPKRKIFYPFMRANGQPDDYCPIIIRE